MAKEWKDQTTNEKLESLKADVNAISMRVQGFELRMGDVAGELAWLRKKLVEGGVIQED